jgi:hypothetical protein
MTAPNTPALIGQLRACGLSEAAIERAFRTFNATAPAFIEGIGVYDAPR